MNSHVIWLLMLLLNNTLTETPGQKAPKGFRYASYEVTIPWKLSFRYGQQESQEVSYLLKIEGRSYVINLKQKRGLVPKQFPVFTYSKNGGLQLDYPFIRDDCFYHGFIQGMPASLVTFSTCSGGLKGVLQLENKTYEIEPVPSSSTFQHVVYRIEGKEGEGVLKCGLTEDMLSHHKLIIQNMGTAAKTTSEGSWWGHTRFVKVAIVVDHERYVKFGRNESHVAIQVLHVIHTANSLYEPLFIELSVVGLEIWSEKNLIVIHQYIEKTLEFFNTWKAITLNVRIPNDTGHLFLYRDFGISAGTAYIGTICSSSATAVESYRTSSFFFFTVIFVHELGHILGMRHDESYCTCDRQECIMAPVHANTDRFSNCSYSDYFKLRNTPCLLIPPDPDKIYQFKYCGNKIVEDGEQCDCGSLGECELDPCCLSNCRLRPGKKCSFGQCCAKCQYLPVGTVCRKKKNICDLPEYCNGSSALCPEDIYVQDGTPCYGGALCYHGNCNIHAEQCHRIFGGKAKVAPAVCFREMNTRGDRFGHCGLKHDDYKRCTPDSILCGRIQCENVNVLPTLEEHTTIIQSLFGNRQCWGTDYHRGMGIPDIGAVRDGTPCGKKKMCINGKCLSVSLKSRCGVTKCHGRGICNTYGHCHCNHGWAPPDCLRKGYGGSINSGHPLKQKTVGLDASRPEIIVELVAVLSVLSVLVGTGIYFRHNVRQLFARLSKSLHQVKPLESPE